ncbi:sulfuric ester hydrolase [Aureococcus anophagefferens]|nr:sulfuric ester hydrolase [Aureococcus anophagefferens]
MGDSSEAALLHAYGNATSTSLWSLTRADDYNQEDSLFGFVGRAYANCLLCYLLFAALPASLTFLGAHFHRGCAPWAPAWMTADWASEASDSTRSSSRRSTAAPAAGRCRRRRAIALQAMVMALIVLHLHGFLSRKGAHYDFVRLASDDAPGLSMEGRCLAAMVSIKILQGDTKRDYKVMKYAASHPGCLSTNACAFLLAVIGCAIGLANAGRGAHRRSANMLQVLTTFAGLSFIMDIDNWFVTLFELDAHDLGWLEVPAGRDAEEPAEAEYATLRRKSLARDSGQTSALDLLRKAIFFVLYPAFFGWIWLYWIPSRSIVRALGVV